MRAGRGTLGAMKSLNMHSEADQALPLRAFDSLALPHLPEPAKPRLYGYRDCLDGTAPAPKDALGKAVFGILMGGGMVTFMTTFNGLRHTGLDFLASSHWLYPVVFSIAMGMRLLYANRVADAVAPRLIFPHLTGVARTAAMSALNVSLMAPVMAVFTALLLKGPDNLVANAWGELPFVMAVAILVNLLVVGPAVRLLYHNVIMPATGARLVQATQRFATTWAGIFTG